MCWVSCFLARDFADNAAGAPREAREVQMAGKATEYPAGTSVRQGQRQRR